MIISSDTNIWFDFEEIGHLEYPFLLNNSYYISDLTFEEEIQESQAIKNCVYTNKLLITSVSSNELNHAEKLHRKHSNISIYDSISLTIAKNRGWILLSGDGSLREASIKEKVECHGSLWIYDQLIEQELISKECRKEFLTKLYEAVESKKRRLPLSEITKRINEI